MTSVKKDGKAKLWIRKGATVVGPATFDCKEILKAHGARWAKDEKGWTFEDDYHRATRALNECAGKIGGVLEEDRPKTSSRSSNGFATGDGYWERREIEEGWKYGIDG